MYIWQKLLNNPLISVLHLVLQNSAIFLFLKTIESHYVLFSVWQLLKKKQGGRELNHHLPVADTSVGLLSREVIGDCSPILTPVSIYERKSKVMKYYF